MNFSSPDMIFLAEHHFFEINYQHKCVEPTKKCLFFNFDTLPWPAWAAQPAGIANFFYMHMDMLIDHSGNKISLGGWPSLGVFLCHCMLITLIIRVLWNYTIQPYCRWRTGKPPWISLACWIEFEWYLVLWRQPHQSQMGSYSSSLHSWVSV